jgi:DNA ligase-1
MSIRPMLAAKYEPERTKLHLEEDGYLLIQPKIDGMRMLCVNGEPRSRSGKLLPNVYLQEWNRRYASFLNGLDAEVISGHVYDPTVFKESMSGIRSADGSREFTVYAFDYHMSASGYISRLETVRDIFELMQEEQEFPEFHAKLVVCPTFEVKSLEEIDAKEAEFLAQGWEGAILRRPYSRYKYNRATAKGGELTKLKRFEDDEAVIVGFEPWCTNNNEATTSELGFTVRSSHQGNKQELERLGAFRVELLRDRSISFSLGVFRGIDHHQRDRLWNMRDSLLGRIVTFKHQGYGGGYEKPRTPVLLGFRDPVEF